MSFKIGRINFKVSFLFLLMFFAVSFFDRSGLFLLCLLSVFFHECGHLTAMLITKKQITGINAELFGLEIITRKQETGLKKELTVLLGGIVFNLAAFCLFYKLSYLLALVNLFYALVSALPIGNLDGGAALEKILLFYINPQSSYKISNAVSVVFLTLVLTAIVFLCLNTFNPTVIILGGYLLINCIKSLRL